MDRDRKLAKLERRIRLLKKEMKGYEEEDGLPIRLRDGDGAPARVILVEK